MIAQLNSEVIARALTMLWGPQAITAMTGAYDAINEAMTSAYDQGYEDGNTEGYNEGFDAGDDQSELDEDQLQAEWDDGYLAGVQDARVDPAEADRHIRYLNEQAFDASNVSDSGDATDTAPSEMNPDDGWFHRWAPIQK